MFPILLRVLTIAGSCTIAALLTRKYLQLRAEKEEEGRGQSSKSFSLEERNKQKKDEESSKRSSEKVEGTKVGDSPDANARSRDSEQVSDNAAGKEASSQVKAQEAEKHPSAKTESESVADMEAARKKREESQQVARQAKSQADERAEKVAKSKEAAALAAQKAVEARRNRGLANSGTFEAVKEPQDLAQAKSEGAVLEFAPEETESDKSDADPLKNDLVIESRTEPVATAETVTIEAKKNPAEDRARIVFESSKQILDNYKHPPGMKVDLSLAQFSIQTAERLMSESRFEEAWEKASAVGLLVGISETRAGIENQLKAMKSDPDKAEQVKAIRATLADADRLLADASQSFISDVAGQVDLMSLLQGAFQKTMQAQNELLSAS